MPEFAQNILNHCKLLLIWILLLCPLLLLAQETMVLGRVFSASDQEPLQGVNIYFAGTSIGTQSDEEGFFVLKNPGSEIKLVFSIIGYKTREVRLQPGKLAQVDMPMQEDIRILQELFVLPGANPALGLLKRVRENRLQNDVLSGGIQLRQSGSELIMLQKPDGGGSSTRIFNRLNAGIVSEKDSSVFIPLYLSSEEFLLKTGNQREILSKNSKASPENLTEILAQIAGDFSQDMNFYRNNIVLLGRSFISPLSTFGNSYYRFFLTDSIQKPDGKEYLIRFRSLNSKNLAFNGEMCIDSASAAICFINAELPAAANINYVGKLSLEKHYAPDNQGLRIPQSTQLTALLHYPLYSDSTQLLPDLFLRRQVNTLHVDSISGSDERFAGSEFSRSELEEKIAKMNDLPLIKTARWIADAIITGYLRTGIIDVGKVYHFSRLSDEEGLRFTLPLRTNEKLWENFSLGGYWGYGTCNRQHYYQAEASVRLPFGEKTLLTASYTNDLRRGDYDYSDYRHRENPLLSGDEDISNTYFAWRRTSQLQHRREWLAALSFDWNDDVESRMTFRHNQYYNSATMPFSVSGAPIPSIAHTFGAINTRFSFSERVYEDHMQRIYIQNYQPVFYLHLEGGTTRLPGADAHPYGKISLEMKHQVLFGFGSWNYSAGAGLVLGNMPAPLLYVPIGSETGLFKRFHYNLMDYGEYSFDKYFSMHHEWLFNGIVFNKIPLIRNLNLRELITFKLLAGGRDNKHDSILNIPEGMRTVQPSYLEFGAGVANIFRIFSLQAVWRNHDTNHPGIRRFGIMTGIRLQF
jgi:hypothetical protein